MADVQRVNGKQISWSSMRIDVGSVRLFGFTGLTFSDKITEVLAYGMGASHAPRGRGAGKYEPEQSKLTGWKASMQALRAELAALSPNGKSYGYGSFTMTGQFISPDEEAITVELLDCRFVGDSSDHSESPDPLQDEAMIQPLRIKRNGLTLYDSSEEDPL